MHRALLALALLASPAYATDTVKKSFDAADVKSLLVEQGVGKVSIIAGDAKQATVVVTKRQYDESACKLTVELDGKRLVVSNKDSWKNLQKKCEADFEITVPKSLDAQLKVGSGDIEVVGLKGDLSYEVGSGDIAVKKADLKDLDGKSGSGNVSVEGTVDDAELKLGAGNAALKLARSDKNSKVDVRFGTGKATVTLPKDATVKSSFKAGLGSLTNEFGQSDNAAFTISGAAGAGDMEIKRF